MRIALITTTVDPASVNIKQHLLDLLVWRDRDGVLEATHAGHELDLYTYDTDAIFLEHLDQELEADMLIFCSKHQSRSGIPSFSVHPIGNFGPADFGGEPGRLVPAHAPLMYQCFHALYARAQESSLPHEVVYEATHHGPATTTPTFFIEIGSSPKHWQDKQAGALVAQALLTGLASKEQSPPQTIIGIGGLHTCPNFNKLAVRRQAQIGHICPVYMLDVLTPQLIQDMVEQTSPAPTTIVLDWKGLKQAKAHVEECLERARLDIPIKRIKDYGDTHAR